MEVPNMQIRSSDWNQYEKKSFILEGREGFIICPRNPLAGSPWLWRAEFFGKFDNIDRALLDQGWFLAYYSVSNLYGCPKSIHLMKEFYDFVVEEFGLNPKTVIAGISRGGLYAVNFAAKYPQMVSSLYLDAPVLDLKSWPGGLGTGDGAEPEWKECLNIYGLDENSILNYRENPIDKLPVLLDAGIPVAMVAGDADTVVPHLENAQKLIDFYQKNSGKFLYILKVNCGHHPHSLEDPAVVVEFIKNDL